MSRAALAIGLLLGVGVFAPRLARADELIVPVPSGPPAQVVEGAEGEAMFVGEGLQQLGEPGDPAIPWQVLTVLLPPDADPGSLSVSVRGAALREEPGTWSVAPVPEPVSCAESVPPPQATLVPARAALDVPYPPDLVGPTATGSMRNWRMVQVAVATYRYDAPRERLYQLVGGELVVEFSRKPGLAAAPIVGDPLVLDEVSRLAVNFSEVAPSYQVSSGLRAPATVRPGYAILTTRAIRAAAPNALSSFVASKRRRGYDAQVITEEVWGGGTGDVAADRIREWLAANYRQLGLLYVLLVGDPDPDFGDAPMKRLWPRTDASNQRDAPSDYYYADLTGDWDLDGDGLSGEFPDDFGIGGVDRIWDVLVGRIPSDGNAAELERILTKLASYESAPFGETGWRRGTLLAMKPNGTESSGFQLGEFIKSRVVIPRGGWRYHRVYDRDFGLVPPPETTPTTIDNVVAAWTSAPFGSAVWWTHGASELATDVMSTLRTAELDDRYPLFTFGASCNNSLPEEAHNLSRALLRNGSIGSVGATRTAWYVPGEKDFAGSGTCAGMAYEYTRRLILDEREAAAALQDVKLVLKSSAPYWMNDATFNLYGDPTLGLFTVADTTTPFLLALGRRSAPTGLDVRNEDIARFDGDEFSIYFQGRDVGLRGLAVDAFALLPDGSIVLSFARGGAVPGLGWVTGSDLVRFIPSSLGPSTAGAFRSYLRGSDLCLTEDSEDIDAIEIRGETLYFSTRGRFAAGSLQGDGQDVAAAPAPNGDAKRGSGCEGLELAFDGSRSGLTRRGENIDAFAVQENGDLLLSTSGSFEVNGLSGSREDVFICRNARLGPDSACESFSPFFDGSKQELSSNVVGVSLDRTATGSSVAP